MSMPTFDEQYRHNRPYVIMFEACNICSGVSFWQYSNESFDTEKEAYEFAKEHVESCRVFKEANKDSIIKCTGKIAVFKLKTTISPEVKIIEEVFSDS